VERGGSQQPSVSESSRHHWLIVRAVEHRYGVVERVNGTSGAGCVYQGGIQQIAVARRSPRALVNPSRILDSPPDRCCICRNEQGVDASRYRGTQNRRRAMSRPADILSIPVQRLLSFLRKVLLDDLPRRLLKRRYVPDPISTCSVRTVDLLIVKVLVPVHRAVDAAEVIRSRE